MKTYIDTQAPDIERIARRRAGAKLGFFIHATVFVAVNLMLALIALANGKTWAVYPFFGWGVGLAIHGVVVFFLTGGGGLHDTLVQRERNRLQLQKDAW